MSTSKRDRAETADRRKEIVDLVRTDNRRKAGPQTMTRTRAVGGLPEPRKPAWLRLVHENERRWRNGIDPEEYARLLAERRRRDADRRRTRAATLLRRGRREILNAAFRAAREPWTGTAEVIAMAEALARAEKEVARAAASATVIEMNDMDRLAIRLTMLAGVHRADACKMLGWTDARLDAVLTDPRTPGIVAEMKRDANQRAGDLAKRMTELGPRAAAVLERATEAEQPMSHQLRASELVLSKLIPTVTAQKIDVRHTHVLDDETFEKLIETGREMMALGALDGRLMDEIEDRERERETPLPGSDDEMGDRADDDETDDAR